MFRHFVFLVFAFTSCLCAAPLEFPEHNFSVEIPDGWTNMETNSPQILKGMQSPDGSQRILLTAVKLPARERESGASDIRKGAKDALVKQGWHIDPEKELTINGQPFVSYVAHSPQDAAATSYTTAAGNEAYMLQAIRVPSTANDSELQSIAQSFRLLKPAKAQPLNAPQKSAANEIGYRIGSVTGRVLFILMGLAAVLAVWRMIRG